MAVNIFNRRENKYPLDMRTFAALRKEITARMDMDIYNANSDSYPILNIYYDTPNSDFIRASVDKPAYKEKLRLRSYGTPDVDSIVYVEIKKKVRGIVNKRRSGMTLREAYQFLDGGATPGIHPDMNAQVLNEAAYILGRKPLKPALFLSYERIAYFGERGLRVSFDTNIQTRRYDLHLEYGAYGEPMLFPGEWLMEIKSAENIPLWLSGLLAEYKVYPISFSKYGEEYERSLTGAVVSGMNRIYFINQGPAVITSGAAVAVTGA